MRSWVFLPPLVISFEVYSLITATSQSPCFSLTCTEVLAPCPSLTFTKEMPHVLLCPPGRTSHLGSSVFMWLTHSIPKPSWLPLLLDFHFNVLEWPAVIVTLRTSYNPQLLRCRQCKHTSVQTIIISCTDVYKKLTDLLSQVFSLPFPASPQHNFSQVKVWCCYYHA